MIFFFELQIFVMLLLTIILGEVVGRGAAFVVWAVMTVLSHAGEFWARRHWAHVPKEPPSIGHEELGDRWARTLLYSWRRTNLLLLLGTLAFGAWYFLGG